MRRPALLVALFLLVACGGGESVEGEGLSSEATGQSEAPGGQGDAPAGTLVAAIGSQPDQLDPHSTTAYPAIQVPENVSDTLVVPNAEDLEMEPSLATGWETSDDGLTWTFTLRDDVTFHDGSTFDSADVAYSFNRIVDEELANAFRFASVESINTPDETTVELVLSEPTPDLLANIGGFKGMAILPEGAAEDLNLATEANGTGPFTLESVNSDSIVLSAFGDYWGDPAPSVDGVEFRFISEPTTALTKLQTGNVDWTDTSHPSRSSSCRTPRTSRSRPCRALTTGT